MTLTGFPGNFAQLADTIRNFEEICDGKHDAPADQASYTSNQPEAPRYSLSAFPGAQHQSRTSLQRVRHQ